MKTDDTLRIFQLINHDEQFLFNQNKASIDPVILNRFNLSGPDYMERLYELIFSDGSGADFVAKCGCGHLEGNNKIGMICPICDTEVSQSHLLDDNNLVCKNWIAAPNELPHGWLTPRIYLNLSKWLEYNKGNDNYLDDILDVDKPLPFDLQGVVTGRGFTYLYENFDRLMNFFIFDHPVISKKPDTVSMQLCIKVNRDKIFCRYIPILNSAINPTSFSDGNNNKRRYSDVTSNHILKAAHSLSHLEFTQKKKKNRQLHVERTAFKAYQDIINYFEESMKQYVAQKKAIPRTHIFGARFHWSFRGVVVPIIGPHEVHELHIPYQLAVNTLRVHLLGILCREYNFASNEAVLRVRRGLQVFDPLLYELMNRMIEETPFEGIPCLWHRPPSIRDGSVMIKYWTKIKTDLNDSCIGISPVDVSLPNADFDGDRLLDTSF